MTESIDKVIFKFNNICRTCLSEGELVSIFFEDKLLKLSDMLMACASVQVAENDGYPPYICVDCTDKTKQAYIFRQQCERADGILRSAMCVKYEKEPTAGCVSQNDSVTKNNANLNDSNDENRFCDTENEPTSENMDTSEDTNGRALPERSKTEICSEEFISTNELTSEHLVNGKIVKIKYSKKFKRQNNDKYKKVTCKICSKKVTTINLTAHMRIHTNDKPFNCEFCGKSFNWKGTFQRHIARHKESNKYQCKICPKSFIGAYEFAYHVNESHPIDDLASRTVDNSANNKISGSKDEGVNTEIKNEMNKTDTVETVPCCEICQKNFSSKGALKVHKLRHWPKAFACDECDKKFSTSTSLKLHKRRHTGEKPYLCEYCNRRFFDSGAYRDHCRVHTGERPYVCKVCKATFTQGAHLRRHVVIHSNEKPFLCNVCGTSFNSNFKLKIHMRLHTGETPYQCSDCGKAYRKASSLSKHRKSKIHAKVNPEL